MAIFPGHCQCHDVPNTVIGPAQLQYLQMTHSSGDQAHALIPGAAVNCAPFQHSMCPPLATSLHTGTAITSPAHYHLKIPPSTGGGACTRIPATAVSPGPLEHLQMPLSCSCPAHVLTLRTAYSPAPLEHLQMTRSSGCPTHLGNRRTASSPSIPEGLQPTPRGRSLVYGCVLGTTSSSCP